MSARRKNHLAPRPAVATEPLYGEGPAAPEIARLCREQEIDLVVMVTHGRKGVSHLLMGSVAEETERLAPCPVLVLHLNPEVKNVK